MMVQNAGCGSGFRRNDVGGIVWILIRNSECGIRNAEFGMKMPMLIQIKNQKKPPGIPIAIGICVDYVLLVKQFSSVSHEDRNSELCVKCNYSNLIRNGI